MNLIVVDADRSEWVQETEAHIDSRVSNTLRGEKVETFYGQIAFLQQS